MECLILQRTSSLLSSESFSIPLSVQKCCCVVYLLKVLSMASLMSEERRGRGRDWASQGSAPEPGLTKPICLGPDLLPNLGQRWSGRMQTRLCVMSQIITKKEETFLNFPARRDGVVLVDCQSSIFWHKRKVPPGLSEEPTGTRRKP